MKNHFKILAAAILCTGLVSARAQMGAAPPTPTFNGDTARLFGDNSAFSASMEMQSTDDSGKTIVIEGKINFDSGKARFDFNMTDVQGAGISPNAAAQMQAMGLDQMVTIARPDKKTSYLIYPGLQGYLEKTLSENEAAASTNDFKTESTELGKETIDGHPCVKNKDTITGKNGSTHEFTVWNATDLNNFPVKIQTAGQGQSVTMLFKNVSLAKPDASLFEVPASYTRYESAQEMMQTVMMKKMGGGGFSPFSH